MNRNKYEIVVTVVDKDTGAMVFHQQAVRETIPQASNILVTQSNKLRNYKEQKGKS